jgi:hypothetical protein
MAAKKKKTGKTKSRKAKPTRKAKTARKTKAKPRRKVTAKPKASEKKSTSLFGDLGLEDAVSEPVADVSGMYRVAEKIQRAQRGADEDEVNQFRDPSLVVDLELKKTLRGKVSHETTQPVREEDIVSETEDD